MPEWTDPSQQWEVYVSGKPNDRERNRKIWEEAGKRLGITLTTWLITDRLEGECSTCGFDAIIRYRAYSITDNGVAKLLDNTLCGRCENERRRND